MIKKKKKVLFKRYIIRAYSNYGVNNCIKIVKHEFHFLNGVKGLK